MGTGASKTSSASLTPSQKPRSNSHNYRTKSHSPTKGKGGSSADVVRVGLTKLGFSPGDVTLTEGQTVEINWNVASGTIAHNIRQVVFDGQTVYPVQGGYNSGSPTSAGTFTINFSLQGEFKFISDGYEANSNKVLVVTVKSRSVITAELTDDQFRPSVLHIHEGNSVKWTWNSCQRPHVINEIKLCPKHYGIVKTTGGTSVPMQSGSYKHEFLNPGLFYFQSEGSENGAMQLCIVHVKATQRHHYIEVTDRRFNPRLITITQGDRVWWLWDRFKCKKKHRILQVDIPTGQGVPDPFPRPVKGGFCSDAPSRAGMLSHIFHDAGVYYYCDNNYEDNREYLGVVIVKPRAKEHHIEVTAEGFYPDLSVISSGDRIWWSWDVDRIQESFSVMQVDSCVASDNKILPEVDCNNFCKHLTKEAAAMVTNIGMATVQLNTPGVYHYRVSDTANNVGCCSVIVNPGQKDHCIAVSDMGFEPKVLTIHPGDRVWWIWEDTKLQHNIIQVSHQGHPIKDGFCSGFPQDSPAAFVSQLSTGAVVYFQSAGLPKMYGAVVMVEQAQVHQVLVSKNHLQPDPVLAQMDDCVAWVWPVLRKHGLTQLTNTQQVFELQTYTQDIVTPRRCCALRFSNPGVYHYYSKAFSNKTDKFMYEHSSKTVLSSVVVSNPSGPITVMVSSKGFKPPTVNIQRGQSVLWSWKGSQSETHNIVHANPPTHERPYSPVQGPLGFSSGNPEPNNSYMFTFEEPGTFYETSEGAPGCVGVIHVLDDESLTSVPAITSSSNGGVVERAHTVELQSLSQTVTILYTLDGSIPELHGQATRVYKPDRRIILRRPGLLIIRAIGISAGALPSKVFTSKRFWVLEGNVGHSSEEDDSVSIATEDFEAELQNSGPGPTIKWQWWNCVPSISGWLHTASDSSIEIYWDLPSIPYRGQLKSYQLIVNGICYHNDLPPTCNSITVEGLLGNQTYTVSIIVQPKDSSLLPQESNRLKVTCPGMYELGGPILSCEITEQEDEINLVWTSMDEVLTDKAQYVVYIDGRENDGQVKTVGQYKKCRMILPHREVLQAPLTVFVLALTEGNSKSDGCLSNELQLALPLSLDNMYVPNGGNLIGKLYLIIKEGSGKPPDPKVELLPSVAPQESFDGSASTLTAPGTALTEDQHDPIIKRSLECEETFNKTGEEALSKPSSTAQTDTPTDSKSDSVSIENSPTVPKHDEPERHIDNNSIEPQVPSTREEGSPTSPKHDEPERHIDTNSIEPEIPSTREEGSPTGSQHEPQRHTDNSSIEPDVSITREEDPGSSKKPQTPDENTPEQLEKCNPDPDALKVPSCTQSSQDEDLEVPIDKNNTLNEGFNHETQSEDSENTVIQTHLQLNDKKSQDEQEFLRNQNTDTAVMDTETGAEFGGPVLSEKNLNVTEKEGSDVADTTFGSPPSTPSEEPNRNEIVDTPFSRPPSSTPSEDPNDRDVGDTPFGRPPCNHSEDPNGTDLPEGSPLSTHSQDPNCPDTPQGGPPCTPSEDQHLSDVVVHDSTTAGDSMLHGNVSVCKPSNVLSINENVAPDVTHDVNEDGKPDVHEKNKPDVHAVVVDLDGGSDHQASDDEQTMHEQDREPDHTQTGRTNTLHAGGGGGAEPGSDDGQGESDCDREPVNSQEKISLPKPVVSVRSQAINTELHIRWQIASSHLTPYVLHHYNVCVAGRQFDTSISSHSRQEMTTDSGETEIHHSWNAGRGHVFVLTGLSENSTYSVTVHATYHHKNATHQGHMKASSKPVICTTGGQPQAPKLLAKSVGLQEVTLSWTPGVCHEDIDVMGYQMIRNGKPLSEIIPYGKTEKLIKNLQPGTKQYFGLSMVTTNAGQTKASNLITVTCPDLPDPPVIRQERSMEERSAVVVWPRQKHKHISLYFVYIDGKLQGEIKAKSSKKQHNHRYILHNLRDNGRQYNVSVKAYAGWMAVKKDHPNEVTCGVMSEASNLLTVTYSSAPLPSTLNLNLECVHAEGADVAWVVPDLNEASLIRGFIILKDGQPHLSNILPPTTTRTTLSGLKPGSSVTVQVLAVTEMNSADEDNDGPSSQDASEVLRIHPPNLIFQSEALNVKYDQLVQAPSRIWCELVRCHSVMVVWDKGKKPRKHYKAAEEYVVTWWELSKKTGEPPQRKLTSDDHLLIDGLDLGTKYCITVQAQGKHKQHHTADKKITGEVSPSNIVLVRSQTESTTVVTASPPQPPSHLDVTSVGATTVQLKWEAPVERGAEVIGLRVYVTMLSDDSVKTTHHTDLLPDVTSTIIKHLVESTTYTIHLVTITDEYFEEGSVSMVSPRSKLRSLPDDWNDVPVDCPWLPCVSVEMTTAGLAPPSGLSCIFGRDDAVTLLWRAPMIQLGVLKRYEVRWLEVRNTGAVVERSDPHETIEVVNEMTSCEIPGLVKGKMYSFMVVAVVSETEKRGQTSKKRDKKRRHHSKEALLRLESEMFVARVPAPCVAPDVMVTSYGSSWVDVYWEKPSLVTSSRNSDDPVCSTCLRRTLLAYKLEVNGAVYATLKPNTQQYTIQCTATQSYEIVLIAITTADKGLAKKASAKPHHMRLASAEYEGMFDESASKTVVVTLPRDQSGNIVQLGAKFHPSIERHNEESEENSDLQGDIHLKWALQDCGTAEEQGIVGYDATWFNDADDEERVATLPQTALSYDIPVYHNRCIYKMTIQANQHDDMWQDVPSPSIQCVIPGPPDPPNLCCTSVMQEEFILEWGEPRLYGGVTVRGYQVYMNDKKVGQELSASHYKAAIPCRPNRTYHMSIVALSADPNYRDSDLSDEVVITCWSPETQPIAQVAATSKRGQGDGCSHGSLCPEDISVGVLELSEMLVVLEWRLPLIGLESQQLVDRIKVLWSSVARPKELEAVLKPTATQYSIKGCIAGTNHFVSVVALDEGDRVIHRSRQLTVQTSAPLATPNLTIRSCTYSGCILEWEKPMQFGNAHLIGYQLRLNGKDHDKLPAGTSTYLFTAGKMCKEYTFTLKALCYIPHLHSKDSDPAIVTWPGVIPPALHRAATTKLNAIKVSWPEPKVTGGAKVQQYKVMCVEESGTGQKACPPDRRQPLKTLGPLSPDQRFAEFPNLSPHAAHTILLDTYVSGIGKAIRSRPMNKQYVARKPAPPSVRVAVRGLEERRALEMEACQLINMRHRVLQELFGYQQESSSSQPPGYIEHSDHAAEISDALSALAEMEEQLFQVLETLLPYTGTVSVDLEWDLIPDKKDVNLSGFKVLVNGKQHGFLLHSNIDRICLQLSAYDGLHKICLIAVTDHPVGNSDPSEVTVINTSPFLPFSCYCLHTTHRKDSRHPKAGCCNFQQTLAIEASPDATSILMSLHQPLVSSRHVPPASVSVMDVFDKAQHLLIPTKLTNRCPTMLLFWTRWCLASMKAMDHFVDYAKNRAGKVICVSCCCNSTEPSSESHIQSLSRQIMQRGWRDDGVIRHSCSCYSNDGGMMPGSTLGLAETQQGQGTEESKADQTEISSSSSAVSVPELFGVRATPMIIILHPEGYLAWQGCYAAYDKATFTSLMDDTLEAVIKTSRISSSSNSPKLLSRATSASSCTISSLPQRQLSPRHFSNVSSSRPPSSSTSSSSQPNGSIPRAKTARRRTLKKRISVEDGPYSGGSKGSGSAETNGRTKSSGKS
ncbi:uncharacterized protein [Asterias amurensis]|uniref:uncharacterized protein isoform X2 n=1 Tax=Asterias amurensis TaxID=7602 RepID=UPI003AB7CD5C